MAKQLGNKPNPTDKKKYDLPGMVAPEDVPTSEALERGLQTVNVPRKVAKPRKIRRII